MPDDVALPVDLISPSPVSAPVPAAPDASVLLDPLKVLGAAGDPARFGILRELAGGQALSVMELAARLKRTPDLISKHLKVLREARMLITAASPDGDGRKQFHEVPAPFRSRDAAGRPVLDFGTVLIRC